MLDQRATAKRLLVPVLVGAGLLVLVGGVIGVGVSVGHELRRSDDDMREAWRQLAGITALGGERTLRTFRPQFDRDDTAWELVDPSGDELGDVRALVWTMGLEGLGLLQLADKVWTFELHPDVLLGGEDEGFLPIVGTTLSEDVDRGRLVLGQELELEGATLSWERRAGETRVRLAVDGEPLLDLEVRDLEFVVDGERYALGDGTVVFTLGESGRVEDVWRVDREELLGESEMGE